jgi:prepilin-type N-terminal cleavage/methylation domain-containing protein
VPDAGRHPFWRLRSVEDGLTLIELLVTMMLFTLIMAGIYGVLINVQRQSRDMAGREETVGNARLATQQMDRQIRSGNVLYDPAAETLPLSMRVYTQANGDQRCVQWQVYNGALRTRSWSTTWLTDGNVTSWGTIARNLRNTTATPPFSLQGGATAFGSRLVDIDLLVKDPTSSGNVLQVKTSLSGRNTQYGYDPGVCNPMPSA